MRFTRHRQTVNRLKRLKPEGFPAICEATETALSQGDQDVLVHIFLPDYSEIPVSLARYFLGAVQKGEDDPYEFLFQKTPDARISRVPI
jgi:hypothetical protein